MNGQTALREGKPLHPALYAVMVTGILLIAPFIRLGMGIIPSFMLIALCGVPMGILLYKNPYLPMLLIVPVYGLSLLYGANPLRALLCVSVLTLGAPLAYALRGKKPAADGLIQALLLSALCYLAVWCAVIYKEYGALNYDNVHLYYSSLQETGEMLSSYTLSYGGKDIKLFSEDLVDAAISFMIKIIPGMFMAALGVLTYLCRYIIQSAAIRIGGDEAVPIHSRIYVPSAISAALYIICALLSIVLLSWESVAGAVCLNLFIMLSPVFFIVGIKGMIIRFRIPERKKFAVITIALLVLLLFVQPILPAIYIALSGACDYLAAAIRHRAETTKK